MVKRVLVFLTKISTMGNTAGLVLVGKGSSGADTSFSPSNTQDTGLAGKMDGQAGCNTPIHMGTSSYLRSERYLHIMQKQLQKNKPTVRRFHFSTQLCTSDAYRLENHCSEAVLVEFGLYEAVRNKKSHS